MGKPARPLTIGSTVLGVGDVALAQEFWTAALGYVPRDEPDDTWCPAPAGSRTCRRLVAAPASPADPRIMTAAAARRAAAGSCRAAATRPRYRPHRAAARQHAGHGDGPSGPRPRRAAHRPHARTAPGRRHHRCHHRRAAGSIPAAAQAPRRRCAGQRQRGHEPGLPGASGQPDTRTTPGPAGTGLPAGTAGGTPASSPSAPQRCRPGAAWRLMPPSSRGPSAPGPAWSRRASNAPAGKRRR
jgi:hypothetical protein